MRRRNQRGVTLMIGAMSLIFLIPLIGLGIDVGFMFAVQSKLQAAVDGGALAAARALSLGESTSAQAASAAGHAANWFAADFPSGYFGTHNTTIPATAGGQTNPWVHDDPINPHLQHVQVTATTVVDTFFMKWFGINSTTIAASSDATRRDAVIMMVLDRSGSMNTSGACPDLISAAKLFAGQFAAGRDYIGAVSFSDGTYMHSAPTTSFQTVLGYTNDSGSHTGQLDNIVCNGGTGTPQALAIAYDQLYNMNLPGALNIMMVETDGLPNTLTLNWWDNTHTVAGVSSGGTCKDMNSKTKSGGGFATKASLPNWNPNGHSMSSGIYSTVPAGIVGALYSGDPWQEQFNNEYFLAMFLPWQSSYTGSNNSTYENSNMTNCSAAGSGLDENDLSDFAWVPLTDVYGNQLNPATNPYAGAVTTTTSGGGTYLSIAGGGSSTTTWTNYHKGVLNATDNAGYQMRTNSTIPAYFFVVGLGGNCSPSCTSSPRTGDPPDNILLQRMANDPNGDLFNTPATYSSCSAEPTCVTYASQPIGTYIFSSNKTMLTQAFLSISSQILRLNH